MILAAVAIAAALALAFVINRGHVHDGPVPATPVEAASGFVAIPVSDVGNDVVHFYETRLPSGKTVRFFVTNSGGGVQAALDACLPCGGAMGHHQHEHHLVCTKCGMQFAVSTFHRSTEACRPLLLSTAADSRVVRIGTDELERALARAPD